jgi:signal transduction histidine kinase
MKNDFVSNVTHELRSPLSAIESYANLVTDDWRNGRSHNLVDYLTIVRNNATRLRKFVTDILDLSKIDAASVEMEKERFDLGVLFQEVVDLFQAKAREKNIRLGAELPSSVSVFADMDKVRQILTNLLGNALKFTPPGGKVTLSAEPAVRREGAGGRFTRITVADNGPGIPEKDQQRIFDRFEQVKEMRESVEGQKGTGLGLAIVRQLVTAHGGQIGLVSAVGRGSAFSVYLPEGEAHVR